MGNRAVISTPERKTSIYLHWNGGRDSVEGFLEFCRRMGYRDPVSDPGYGLARLAQTIANFFGPDGLSVGIGDWSEVDADNHDNGAYIVGRDWQIVDRQFKRHDEQCHHELESMIKAIFERQPLTTQEAYRQKVGAPG